MKLHCSLGLALGLSCAAYVEGREGLLPRGPEPSVRYHSERARILTFFQDLQAKGECQGLNIKVRLPKDQPRVLEEGPKQPQINCPKGATYGWDLRPVGGPMPRGWVSWVKIQGEELQDTTHGGAARPVDPPTVCGSCCTLFKFGLGKEASRPTLFDVGHDTGFHDFLTWSMLVKAYSHYEQEYELCTMVTQESL
uniref:Imp biosynthesis protein n=1 Tax=Solanum tuberosum TaxID=4113 RepID=M1AZY1_SOLTU